MSIKNPYKLIDKANTTFDLYLDKYEEIEKYMISSKKEQDEIKNLIISFLNQYNVHQSKLNDINQKFFSLFESLIMNDEENKKLFNDLEVKINDLYNQINTNDKSLMKVISQGNNNFDDYNSSVNTKMQSIKNMLELNFNDLDNSISINNDLVGVESEKQLSEIRALGESVSVGFDQFSNLPDAVQLFVKNYNECKRCFFNDMETVLKNYLDTDLLFRTCYFNNIEFLSYSPSENRILLKTKEGIVLETNNRFYTLREVIGFDAYSVPQLYQFDDFVVFDIGMNRAYASLRFASFENCSAVYGFEIDEETYNKAIDNINLNPSLSNKIIPHNFGLSNENDLVKLYYLQGADGVSTIEHDMVNVQYEFKNNIDKVKSKTVEVKVASEVINNILENYKIDSKIVLKVDTEGAEYRIIDNLIETGLINKFDLIVGEGHKFNDRNISDDLLKEGFKKIEFKENEIVYNFSFIKEDYYDIWPLNEG